MCWFFSPFIKKSCEVVQRQDIYLQRVESHPHTLTNLSLHWDKDIVLGGSPKRLSRGNIYSRSKQHLGISTPRSGSIQAEFQPNETP